MTKAEIAEVLDGIADLVQIKGDDPRKAQAYRYAARALYALQEDIQKIYEQDRLKEIPGVGPSIVEKIEELISTGKCAYFEELKASVPSGVIDLMSIPGVGPSTAAKLYRELNIVDLESLKQALDEQKLRGLKGMGKKTEEKIREGLSALLRYREHRLMGYILPVAEAISDSLRDCLPQNTKASVTGDLRRRTETLRDVQILIAHSGAEVRSALTRIEWIEGVNSDWTDSGGSAKIIGNTTLWVKLVEPEEFGLELIRSTGSSEHVAQLEERARQLGLDGLGYWAIGKTEEEIYSALGLHFIVPEIREGAGEVQSAISGQLPELIDIGDICGDLHVHSTWSDGNETIEAMANACKRLGYEYVAFCDHSVSSKIANGLDVERLLNKMIDVREINERVSGIEILMGAEVDILKDGRLDYPDEILEKLDVVIASVHSGFSMEKEAMTKRIISAIENPFVHIIGHPTGRLLNKREPYSVDISAIISASAENNKFLELNAYPDRLDLKDEDCRKAKEHGVMLAINTDAHNIADLGFIKYGIYTARRGWMEKKDVLNALPLTELKERLSHRK